MPPVQPTLWDAPQEATTRDVQRAAAVAVLPTVREAAEQTAHLERVSVRIAAAILAFCRQRRRFRMEELREAVEAAVGKVAPGSPDRVLRQLRQEGKVDYRVVSRQQSLYEVVSVRTQREAA